MAKGPGDFDFFLDFGSNAKQWATGLATDLKPATRALTELNKLWRQLDTQSQAVERRLNASLAKVAEHTSKGRVPLDPAASAVGAGDGGANAGALTRDFEALAHFTDSLVTKMAVLDEAMSRLTGTTDKATLAEETKRRRQENIGQQPVYPQGSPYGKPGGLLIKEHLADPKILATSITQLEHSVRELNRKAAGQGDQPVPGVRGVTEAQIDTAQLDRMVAGIQAQVEATKSVESAIDRLAGRLNAPRGEEEPVEVVPTKAPAAPSVLAPELKAQLENLSPEEAQRTIDQLTGSTKRADAATTEATQATKQLTQAEKDAAIGIKAGMTQKQKGDLRSAAAAAEKEEIPGITKAERQRRKDIQSRLDIAADEQAFRDAVRRREIKRAELNQIAATYSTQGYPVPAGRGTKIPDVVESILGARKQYELTGGRTTEDLRTSGKTIVEDIVPDRLRAELGDVFTKAVEGATTRAAAVATQSLSAQTGGDIYRGPEQPVYRGDRDVLKGQLGRGAAFGGSRNIQVEQAEQNMAAYFESLDKAAAAHLRTRAGSQVDPFAEGFTSGIEGRGAEPLAAKDAAAALRRQSILMDKEAKDVNDLSEALQDNERFIDRATQRLHEYNAAQKRGGEISPELYEKVQEDATKLPQAYENRARIAAQLAAQPHAELYTSPEFIEAQVTRRASQKDFEARQAQTSEEAKRQILGNRAIYEGVGGYLARGVLQPGSKEDMAQRVPGLTYNEKTGFFGLTDGLTATREALIGMNRAIRGYQASLAQRGRVHETPQEDVLGYDARLGYNAPKPSDVSRALSGAERSIDNKTQAMLTSFEQVFGYAAVSFEEMVGRTPRTVEARTAEVARQERTQRVLGPGQILPQAPTPAEFAARRVRRDEVLAEAKARADAEVARAEKRAATATEARTTAIKRNEDALSDEARAARDAAIAERERAGAELTAARALANRYQGQGLLATARDVELITGQPRDLSADTTAKLRNQAITSATDPVTAADIRRLQAPLYRPVQELDPNAIPAIGATGVAQAAQRRQRLEGPQVSQEAYLSEQQAKAGRRLLAAQVDEAAALGDLEAIDKEISASGRDLAQARKEQARLQREVLTDPALRDARIEAERKRDAAASKVERLGRPGQYEGGEDEENTKKLQAARRALAKREQELEAAQAAEAAAATESAAETRRVARAAEAETLARKEATEAAKKDKRSTEEKVRATVEAARAERDAIRAKGGYRQADRQALAAQQAGLKKESPEYQAIQGQIDQINATRARLTELRGIIRGGDGSGPGGPGGPGGGGGRYDNDILRQILAVLRAIHTTLRAGIRTGVRAAPAGAAAEGGTRARRGPASSAGLETYAAELGKVEPELAELVKTERTAATAVQLVEQGHLSAARAMELYRKELGVTGTQQKEFAQSLVDAQSRYTGTIAGTRAVAEAKKKEAAADREQVALSKRAATESERKARTQREEAAQILRTRAATDQLSASTRAHVESLRRLHDAGAPAAQIVAQQARVYTGVAQDLKAVGAQAGDITRGAQGVLSGAGPKVTQEETLDIGRTARAQNAFKDLDEGAAAGVPGQGLMDPSSAFTKALFGDSGFWSRILASTGTFLIRNFSAGLVFGLTNALQEVIVEALATEATFIRVSEALDATGKSTGNLRTQLQDISTEYATSLNDVYSTAAGLVGLFDDVDELAGATEVVSQLQLISGGALSATEAMGILASITAAFGEELETGTVDSLTHVADVLTVVQDNLGVNIEVTAEGVGRMSGLAAQLKIQFEDVAVYVGQIAKLTNQTGAAAGEQFSRILGAMQTGAGRGVLQEAFAGTGVPAFLQEGEYGKALEEMMRNWDNLSEAQQRNVAVALGGQRQAATITALFSDTAKTLDTVAKAHDAHGEAASRSEKMMQTLQKQVAQLATNLQGLGNALVRTGLLNFFGILLKLINGVLGPLNHFFSVINDFADKDPLLSWVKDIGFGIVGMIVLFKVLGRAFSGLGAAMRTMPAVEAFRGAAGAAGARGPVFGPQPAPYPGATTVAQRYAAGGRPIDPLAAQRPAPTPLGGGLRATDRALSSIGTRMTGFGTALQQGADQAREAGTATRRAALVGGIGTGIAGVGRGADAASRGLTKVGTAMDGVSAKSAVLEGALTGVLILFAGAYSAWQANKDTAEENEILYEQMLGKNAGKSKEQIEEERYIGPAHEAVRAREEARSGFFGRIQGGTRLIGEVFSQAATGGGAQGYGDAIDRAAGNLSDEQREIVRNILIDGGKAIDTAAEGQTASIAEVQNASQKYMDQYADAVQAIKDDSSLSEEQEQNALADLESARVFLEDKTRTALLLVQGLSEFTNLSIDQINQISAARQLFTTTAAGNAGVRITQEFGAAGTTIIGETGVQGETRDRLEKLSRGGLSQVESALVQQDIIRDEIGAAQANLDALLGKGGETRGDEEQIKAAQATLQGLMGEYAALVEGTIQAFVDEGAALSADALAQGDYAGARAALRAAAAGIRSQTGRNAPRRRFTELYTSGLEQGYGSSFVPEAPPALDPTTRAKNRAILRQNADTDNQIAIEAHTFRLEQQKAATQGASATAALDVAILQRTYQIYLRSHQQHPKTGASIQQVRQAKIAWMQGEISLANSAQSDTAAGYAAQAAGLWNAAAIAQVNEAGAAQALTYARANFAEGSAEVQGALASYLGAQHATIQALDAQSAAARETELARIAPGNAVAIAAKQVSNANAAVADAAKFGTASTEYQSAIQQQIQAQNAYDDALAAVVQARTQLAVSIATAAGNTVRAADLTLRGAQQALAAALEKSGGVESADVLAARASVVSAEAGARDARYQSQLDTVDFQLQMERITAAQAIKVLQHMLKTDDLTKAQRRELLLKIKGLRDEMDSGESIWNLGDIKLPTPYEVRRSLGVDRIRREARTARETMRDALGDFGGGERDGAAARTYGTQGDEVTRAMNNLATAMTSASDVRDVTIEVNGADVAKVRAVLQDLLGGNIRRSGPGRRKTTVR